MTPYKKGMSVIIDPTVRENKFTFGKVNVALKQEMGTIERVDFFRRTKETVYQVKFTNHEDAIWLAEDEILLIGNKR